MRVTLAVITAIACAATVSTQPPIGREVAIAHHLVNGEELTMPLAALIEHGSRIFSANWTDQDGGGRPLTTGTGQPLSDRTRPLTGARGFNRISGPDANSCQGCHNLPLGVTGGGGDVTTIVFEGAQRFDFIAFDRKDAAAARGASSTPLSMATVGNPRASPALLGAGSLEMLARQMTRDLQRTRDALRPGQSSALTSKGVSFGTLARRADGTWDTRGVSGLPAASVATSRTMPLRPPDLIVRPWQQGRSASLRETTNTLFNQHLGMQTTERFGVNTDPDGDGVKNELTRGDVTAAVVFQATLAVPGRVIPNDPDVEHAVGAGERLFERIRCSTCHVPAMPLDDRGWIYTEPGPYNGEGNYRASTGTRGSALSGPTITIDLTDSALPPPRLAPSRDNPSVVLVPAYTDFKLHDITDSADASAAEPLDGNRRFLTRRLWGAANEPPYFHHGLFTTLRDAVVAHAGEALESRTAFQRLDKNDQDALIEFLKSLQVLPPGTRDLVVDERYRPRR